MVYRSSTFKFSGKTRTYYVLYRLMQKLRNGKKRMRTKVIRVYISGKLKKWSRGLFPSRFGTKIYGIKISYINPIKIGAGRGHNIHSMRVSKIIPIPREARNARVMTKAPRGPRLDIT